MKKFLIGAFLVGASFLGFNNSASAQSYSTAGGLFIDVGDGSTFVGPALKQSIGNSNALQGMVLFGDGAVALGVEYSYNQSIPGARGLSWNVGVGPQLIFGNNITDLMIRPSLGLEYTIPNVPINLGFDWRPAWRVTHDSHFTAGRFGIALRYVFK